MSTTTLDIAKAAVPQPDSAPESRPDRERVIRDQATMYRNRLGLRTIRLHAGATLAILAGHTVALMMPRPLARQVRRVLGCGCGPVFTGSHPIAGVRAAGHRCGHGQPGRPPMIDTGNQQAPSQRSCPPMGKPVTAHG